MIDDNPLFIVVAYVRANCKCPPSSNYTLRPMTAEERAEHAQKHVHDPARCPLYAVQDLSIGWYTVRRYGAPKKEGGKGVTWACTCGERVIDQTKSRAMQGATCRHLKALYTGNVVEIEDPATAKGPGLRNGGYYVKLTPEGAELLRYSWAVKALKDASDGS